MPRSVPARVFLPAALPLVVGLAACGPSFQAIYEGNARFEHCYALEENPQASMPKKAACWRDWSERYTYGQTRDRVHYATARYVALSQAPSLPTDEAMMMAAPGEAPRLSTITAPAPTNAFAPPPKVLEAPDPKVAPPSAHREVASIPVIDAGAPAPFHAPVLPAASCADTCGDAYRGCSGGCDGVDPAASAEARKAAKSCQACLKTYRTCMRDCFK
ncbi:MAG: hypothetical protein KF795_00040 [Labilithrix sp.]|nr:hypothetical protein [Labilithrix sp.]